MTAPRLPQLPICGRYSEHMLAQGWGREAKEQSRQTIYVSALWTIICDRNGGATYIPNQEVYFTWRTPACLSVVALKPKKARQWLGLPTRQTHSRSKTYHHIPRRADDNQRQHTLYYSQNRNRIQCHLVALALFGSKLFWEGMLIWNSMQSMWRDDD